MMCVFTSSMSAIAPQPEPQLKDESQWSDADLQIQKKNYYGASKTIAENKALELSEK